MNSGKISFVFTQLPNMMVGTWKKKIYIYIYIWHVANKHKVSDNKSLVGPCALHYQIVGDFFSCFQHVGKFISTAIWFSGEYFFHSASFFWAVLVY